ncbi:hypothetical protein [Niabella aquatica]
MNTLRINSFLNIPFGESKEAVITKITERGGRLDNENGLEDALLFNNLKFAGRDCEFMIFNFVNDKFCRAFVYLKANLDSKTIGLYSQIKGELNEKYYMSREDYETYEYPYAKNDGHAETAIILGKANFSCFWKFKNDTSNDDDYISLRINEQFSIIVVYESGRLMTEFENLKKQNNYSDY